MIKFIKQQIVKWLQMTMMLRYFVMRHVEKLKIKEINKFSFYIYVYQKLSVAISNLHRDSSKE